MISNYASTAEQILAKAQEERKRNGISKGNRGKKYAILVIYWNAH